MQIGLKAGHIAAGATTVVVGYSGAVVLVIETARVAGASAEEIVSWLVVLGVGMGITSMGLSLFYRMPIVTAWSTPGAAFLIANAENYSLGDTIGACVLAGLLAFISMQIKACSRLIELIPPSLSTAMLAGILLPFCLAIFIEGQSHLPYLVGFLICYLLTSLALPRYAMLILLCLALLLGQIMGVFESIQWQRPGIVWMQPTWSWSSIFTLAVPLFLVTMLSQNLPGVAILHGHGYKPSSRIIISAPSILQTLAAPLGGFTFNLAAITAAICMGKPAGEKHDERYWAGVCAGFFYLLIGLLGAAVVSVFEQFPSFLTAFLAGFALLGTLQANIISMLKHEEHRTAAMFTFLCCASGVSLFGIGAAIWGLLLGAVFLIGHQLKTKRA